MTLREFARSMRETIQQIKDRGHPTIEVDHLIDYLNKIERSDDAEPSATELKRYDAVLQQHVEDQKHANAQSLEMFRSVIVAGQNANRSMVLINGGASVAILAFLGHLAQIGSTDIPKFANGLAFFVGGTLLAGLVSGGTYLSQWLFGHNKIRTGNLINWIVIIMGIGAYVTFAGGAWITYDGFIVNPPSAGPARLND
ncbi:hypothetical protein [Microbaculum sp. FT89]|uniref:hypothetical protein n=1 Tax=Microbaculum sp. FT89 TaxID=3447298 RepID=UPI003F53E1A1